MTNEEILQEMRDAIKLNNEAKAKTNEALTHAANIITKLTIKDSDILSKEYERGIKDAWDLAMNICGYGHMSYDELGELFNTRNIATIIGKYDYASVKKKMDEYMSNRRSTVTKTTELVRGDVVECEGMPNEYEYDRFKGVFFGDTHPGKNETGVYHVLTKECIEPLALPKDSWFLRKTGKHIDIFTEDDWED